MVLEMIPRRPLSSSGVVEKAWLAPTAKAGYFQNKSEALLNLSLAISLSPVTQYLSAVSYIFAWMSN